MRDIKELDLEDLKKVLDAWHMPVFHALQIYEWIYKKGAFDFEQMSSLPFDLRRRLKEKFYILGLEPVKIFKSQDGTEKFLFEFKDGNLIEAVNIPSEKRATGCVSTQVGCKFACLFCASGCLGFKRNLSFTEILDEILYLKNSLKKRSLTHLVFMGTGEPLDNYENVLKSIRAVNSSFCFNIGARRITISTSGVIPGIKKLAGENLQIELSVSLHASDDKTRSYLMPINKVYPLKELIGACREYIKKTNRQITFEYILIKDVNSDLKNAERLAGILKQLNCKVNLIPCNPIIVVPCPNPLAKGEGRGEGFNPPKNKTVLMFKDYLLKSGITTTLRMPRGNDIEAACGQLRLSRYEKNKISV